MHSILRLHIQALSGWIKEDNCRALAVFSLAIVLLLGLSSCTAPPFAHAPVATTPNVEAPTSSSNFSASPLADNHHPATGGDVSDLSVLTGISREEDAQLTPSHPSQVTARLANGASVLTWLGTGDDRIQYYQLYRRASDSEDWLPISRVEAIEDNRGWYGFTDSAIAQGIAYRYGVSAIDVYGHESAIAETSTIASP
jgi:hypothetical protein